jgi:hypothetical protein
MIDYQYTHFDRVNPDGTLGKPRTFAKELLYFAGKDVEIVVRKKRSRRTVPQNRLYRAYVKLLAEYTGYSEDEMHSIISYKFLKTEKVNEDTGEVDEYIRSTSSLNKMEFTDFVESFKKWAEDKMKVRLPNPEETWEIVLV